MIAPPETMLLDPTIPDVPIWRLSVAQYHAMIEAGILTDDDPVELLEGWLIPKMPKNPAHTLVNELTGDALKAVLPAGFFVNVQEPFTTAYSEPEPDVMVVRGNRHDYGDRHPYPADIALVIEVSDATLARDRAIKLRLYAGVGIPAYWILNLPQRQLEVYTDPCRSEAGGEIAYQQRSVYTPDDLVSLLLDGTEVARLPVRNLLP